MGTNSGEILVVRLHNLSLYIPWVTPIRLWLWGKEGKEGRWGKEITATCPSCGLRFRVMAEIIEVIKAMHHSYNLDPNESPCLKLPEEAWEEPRLLSDCPKCHKTLRFNPFIVDNRDRY